jgi:hypothetical protein
MDLIKIVIENIKIIFIGLTILIAFLFFISPEVMLNGISTGIGVIIAHEFYDTIKKYQERVKNNFIKKI